MKKKAVKIAAAMICLIVLTVSVEMVKLGIKTSAIRNDYSSIYDDPKYSEPVSVDGVNVITQDVSCGYAVIQMFSSWDGGNITEKDLYDEYGKVVTSTGNAFCDEMNKRFPDYTTEMYEYQTNTELIDLVYESLRNGVPVPFEWAALYGDEWTLHYSLVTGMDIPSDTVTIANPYGYYETISIGEFLDRTSFEAYEHMPLFLKLGFAFGVFEKNTVFIVTPG
ncbi:MAG: C39 family peptidase [Clostridiales bacterium]|nr:C39 family peptidase [Clostridiales bacterium]